MRRGVEMKIKYYIVLLLFFVTSNAFTLMKGSGDLLHPMSSTNISLSKAIINIDYDFNQSEWLVNVMYEFENPEDESTQKVVLISKSDCFDDFTGSVKHFEIMVNGVNCSIEKVIQAQPDSSFFRVLLRRDNLQKR